MWTTRVRWTFGWPGLGKVLRLTQQIVSTLPVDIVLGLFKEPAT